MSAPDADTAGALDASQHDAFFDHAIAFFRDCLETTPLRKFAAAFDVPSGAAGDAFRAGFSEGLDAFGPDLARWGLEIGDPEPFFDRLLLAPYLFATYAYRVSRALHLREVERTPGIIGTLARLITGTEIYYSADIGPGLKVIHGGGTLIGAGSTIGEKFTIYQNVTIGDRLGRESGVAHRPVIGDRVIATAGAQILGPVTIGSRAVIGANSMVVHSVPEQRLVAGIPAKVVASLTDEAFEDFWRAIKG